MHKGHRTLINFCLYLEFHLLRNAIFILHSGVHVSVTFTVFIVGKSNFSEQFRKVINRYKRIDYSLDIMRQASCQPNHC